MSEDRLRKGAKVLGDFWASGKRCVTGWMAHCECEKPTDFCKAKALWCRLAAEAKRPVDPDSVFGIIEAFTLDEITDSGLTVLTQFPAGVLEVGKKGSIQWSTLKQYLDTPRDLDSVILVLSKFPGSSVVQEEATDGRGKA